MRSKTYRALGLFLFFITSFIIFSSAFAHTTENFQRSLLSPQLIPAKAAIVVDTNKSVLYAKNPKVKLPPASTIKLMTAMVVLDRLDLKKRVVISKNAASVHSIEPRLKPNEELTVKDLLHLALMRSANSATVALAEEVAGSEKAFVRMMNQKALTIGARDTRFVNTSGLPKKGQYTTVYDLTLIMEESLKYPLIKEILGKKQAWIVTSGGREMFLENTDKLLWVRENMIGGKTGYTRQARHCFVGALEAEHGPILIAILGASSREKLWQSTQLLFNLGVDPQGLAYLNHAPAAKQRHKRDAIRVANKN